MESRIDKQGLLDAMSAWNGFLKRKVHLIACGGTALTLLNIKASTKDIDLLVPETASYDVSEDKVNGHLEHFVRLLKKEGFEL